MEEISVAEVVNLLERAVHERRTMEKGLEIARALQGPEQKVQELHRAIDTLEGTITQLTAEKERLETVLAKQIKDGQSAFESQLAQHQRALDERSAALNEMRAAVVLQRTAFDEEKATLRAQQEAIEASYAERRHQLENQIGILERRFAELRDEAMALKV